MKKIISQLLVVSIGVAPVSELLVIQQAQAQTSSVSAQQAQQLLERGIQQTQHEQH